MPKNVDRVEVQRLVEGGAQLVEVLPHEEYEEEHLPGAISLPLRRIEGEARNLLDPDRPVVVYCFDFA
jgi:rhodanese-related sulfurtransferase